MATTDSAYNLTTEDDSYYDYDYEDEVCNKSSIVQFGATLTPVVLSIVVILSLFGNILVIVILAKYENLKSLTNTLILNLAISDLFFTAGLPFWVYYHMYGWALGQLTCQIVNFFFYVGFYSSGILLILMTAHRYVAVMNPLSDIVSTAGSYSVIACVIIWANTTYNGINNSTVNRGKNYCSEVFELLLDLETFEIYSYILIFILSIIGNCLLLYVLFLYENLKHFTNLFVLNLACSDLMITVTLPFWAVSRLLQDWDVGHVACTFVTVTQIVGIYSSIILLTAMTVDRFITVVLHNMPRNKKVLQASNRRKHRTVVVVLCIVAAFIICWVPYTILDIIVSLNVPENCNALKQK
ncbi:C-C chemokine receptor type 4-like [Pseudochaenichthys georgianus]|uniref:C-C chemokine receptor type 4-like n=1 Tax=Pseudochaenichthys georgianus TaxID=52239 RepID=UPI0039C16C02